MKIRNIWQTGLQYLCIPLLGKFLETKGLACCIQEQRRAVKWRKLLLLESLFQVNKPDIIIAAHSDKASLVRFNPVADSVIATAAFDWLVKIWSLNLGQVGVNNYRISQKVRTTNFFSNASKSNIDSI